MVETDRREHLERLPSVRPRLNRADRSRPKVEHVVPSELHGPVFEGERCGSLAPDYDELFTEGLLRVGGIRRHLELLEERTGAPRETGGHARRNVSDWQG